MATPKVYVICDDNCKFEGMTKEQILAAIAQAVETGSVGNCDTGFITTIKTVNGKPLRFFVGTQAEYVALDDKSDLFAIITNDTTKEGIISAIEELQTKYTDIENGFTQLQISIPTIYRKKSEAYKSISSEDFENIDNILYDGSKSIEVDISNLMMENKSENDVLGISGTFVMSVADNTYTVFFSGLINKYYDNSTKNYDKTAVFVNWVGGDSPWVYIFSCMLFITKEKKIYIGTPKFINMLPDTIGTAQIDWIKIRDLNLFYR